MKVHKKVSISGEFAKVGEDFKDGDIIKILNAGEIIPGEWGDRQMFKISVSTGEKNLSFNQTSVNNLIDVFGEDTQKWVGQNVKVWVVKQMIDGKLRNVAYLTGVDWEMLPDDTFSGKKVDPQYPNEPTGDIPF